MKAKQIRSKAWNALKGKYWWAVLAALIAWLFGVVSMGQATSQIHTTVDDVEEMVSSLPTGIFVAGIIVFATILIISVVMSVLSGSVSLGYARFNMNLYTDEERPTINLLFSRLGIVWKAFFMQVLRGLLIGLGCILLIVPGIIIALGLSQCEYILAENPDLKIGDVFKKSREMMKGNKWRFFCLALSFLGWDMLAGIVPAGPLFLTPYIAASEAAFYLDLAGRLEEAKEG